MSLCLCVSVSVLVYLSLCIVCHPVIFSSVLFLLVRVRGSVLSCTYGSSLLTRSTPSFFLLLLFFFFFHPQVRKGESVSNDSLLKVLSLFNDELTLDNMSRAHLVSMCKLLGLVPFGNDLFLRFQLKNKLRQVKNDDKVRFTGCIAYSISSIYLFLCICSTYPLYICPPAYHPYR